MRAGASWSRAPSMYLSLALGALVLGIIHACAHNTILHPPAGASARSDVDVG